MPDRCKQNVRTRKAPKKPLYTSKNSQTQDAISSPSSSIYHSFSAPSRRQLDRQPPLLPQTIDILPTPVPTLLTQLKVKVPDHAGQDEAHLHVGQVLADAVARAHGEGLQDGAAVVGELRGRGVEPALGDEGQGAGEVGRGGEGRPVVDADDCLLLEGLLVEGVDGGACGWGADDGINVCAAVATQQVTLADIVGFEGRVGL